MIKVIRKATADDLTRVRGFLDKANISQEGVEETSIHSFLLLENAEGTLEASIGIEKLGESGLLRSLVILPSLKEEEILKLFQQVEDLAVENFIHTLYLVTNKPTTLEFFLLLGFVRVNKSEISDELIESNHFLQSISMGNTIIMKKSLK